MSNTQILAGLTLLAAFAWGTALSAQDSSCPGGRLVGDLQITGLDDAARTHTSDWEVRFRTEPKIRGVVDGGAADGVLEAGDMLVSVNNHLITTDEGGHLFANLKPDERVTLRIRRDGNLLHVNIVPVARCEQRPAGILTPRPAPVPRAGVAPTSRIAAVGPTVKGAPSGAARPRTSAAPAPRKPTLPPPPAPQAPTIRFGFRLQCQNCDYLKTDAKGWPYWSFPAPPALDKVEPGSPADRAGLRPGDRLTHINGVPLTSPEGGRRLAEAEVGDSVEWTYLRGTERRTARLIAAGISRPRNNDPQARPISGAQPTQLRFSGNVGPAEVEVRGAPVNVTEDLENGEIMIRSQDVLVRIKVPTSDKQ